MHKVPSNTRTILIAAEQTDPAKLLPLIKKIISNLPDPNKVNNLTFLLTLKKILQRTCQFLATVASYAALNDSPASVLAKSLAPIVLLQESLPHTFRNEIGSAIQVVQV